MNDIRQMNTKFYCYTKTHKRNPQIGQLCSLLTLFIAVNVTADSAQLPEPNAQNLANPCRKWAQHQNCEAAPTFCLPPPELSHSGQADRRCAPLHAVVGAGSQLCEARLVLEGQNLRDFPDARARCGRGFVE